MGLVTHAGATAVNSEMIPGFTELRGQLLNT